MLHDSTLHFVGLLVRRSVRQSVSPSRFTFLGFLPSLASLLLLKWSSDWCSRVSCLVHGIPGICLPFFFLQWSDRRFKKSTIGWLSHKQRSPRRWNLHSLHQYRTKVIEPLVVNFLSSLESIPNPSMHWKWAELYKGTASITNVVISDKTHQNKLLC